MTSTSDNETTRSVIFRYLFECEKQTNGANPFNQVNNLMNDFKLGKYAAESYIMEFIGQYEKVVDTYIPKKNQVYGEFHYKTISEKLTNLYKIMPYY